MSSERRISPASSYIFRQRTNAPAPAVAHEDVLGDAEVGEDHRLLVDRDDTVALRLGRRAQRDELTVEAHFTGVGLMDAGHRLDQGRLAGAVLADERVDLPGEELDPGPLERPRRPELLRHVGERHHGCARADVPRHVEWVGRRVTDDVDRPHSASPKYPEPMTEVDLSNMIVHAAVLRTQGRQRRSTASR